MWKPKERLRIAEDVAERLRAMILRGQYRAGDKLPPERKLAETLGVNRATLREALKTLEHGGLVRIRQGDGTHVLDFVQTAGLDLLRHLAPLAEETGLGVLCDVLEFRQIVGREVARLAAGRASDEQVERLRRIAERPMDDPEEILLVDLEFYTELARATGNVVFALLLNTVRGTVRSLGAALAHVNPPAEDVRLHHREVLAALAAHDGEAACRASDAHLRRGKERFLARVERGTEVLAAPPAPHAGPAVAGC